VTIIVGVRCTDGVAIGADSIATSSHGPQRLIQILSDDKINIVANKIIIACTGAVGLSQRFHGIVKTSWDTPNKHFQKTSIERAREIARATIKDFEHTGVPRHPPTARWPRVWSLNGCAARRCGSTHEFGLLDFQPEIRKERLHFVSMGSGQLLTDPFLAFVSRVLWGSEPPNVQMGALGLYWVLSHTIQYAPGGVGKPIKIAVLKKEKGDWVARSVEGDELQEAEQHVAEIEKLIRGYPAAIVEAAKASPPPTPPKE
jgi:hypothetical protein